MLRNITEASVDLAAEVRKGTHPLSAFHEKTFSTAWPVWFLARVWKVKNKIQCSNYIFNFTTKCACAIKYLYCTVQ